MSERLAIAPPHEKAPWVGAQGLRVGWLGPGCPASPWGPASGTACLRPRGTRVRAGAGFATGSGSVGATSADTSPSAALQASAAIRSALVYWFQWALHIRLRPSFWLEGTVIGECHARHRHQEFLAFLRRLDRSYEARPGPPSDPR